MKRMFCDCCGKEFKYGDELRAVNGGSSPIVLPIHNTSESSHTSTHVNGTLRIIFEFDNVPNGQHIDVCSDCRWGAIDKLDPRSKEFINSPDSPARRFPHHGRDNY